MGSQEVVVSSDMVDASVNSCDGGPLHREEDVEETENLGANLLNDLDLYLEDLNDRLTISRMVSNSFIKGTICAVEEEAKEKIQQKELELARLKETVHLYPVGSDGNEALETCCKQMTTRHGLCLGHGALLGNHRSIECLNNLKDEAEKQFKNLKKEIDKIKGSSPIGRKNSASELRGLGGILQEQVSEKWIDVDRGLDGLRATLDSVHRQAFNVVHTSESSLLEWQMDQEFQAEIEGIVTKSLFQGLRQEFEQKLWHQNVQCHGNKSAKLAKIKKISSLLQELDAISKSLSTPESGHLVSHRSLEQRKASGNHASSTTLWEGNGKHDHSIIVKPENLELAQLSHLSKEQLLEYFKTEMTKMKRHHESKLQEKTEEYFSLMREYLNERGSSLLVRKDKEFDTLRKKIPEIVCKLDEILLENEKLPTMDYNVQNLDSMKDKMELLYTENCRLSDLLADGKKEIKLLASEVYDAEEKISAHSVIKANLSKTIVDLNGAIEDAQIEASISEDIYKLLLKEVVGQIESFSEQLVMGNEIMEGIYDIIFREAVHTIEPASKLEIEDSDAESIITEGLYKIILWETLKEAMEKLDDLNLKYAKEKEIRLTLEMEVLEKEKAIGLSMEVRQKLEHEILSLTANVDEKDSLLRQAADALAKEKDKFKFASLELDKLRTHANEQEMLISRCSEESQVIKTNLAEALKKIELYEEESCKLQERLALVTEKLRETAEEKSMLLVVSQEKQQLIEARENEQRKQMDSISVLAHGLSRAVMHFESRATEDIDRNSARLEYLRLQLGSLLQKISKLKKVGLQYKQKLEKRCSDLQKAEDEVDLLGDEVDTLLSLLEKIYIALDHYSPILQHYPGITEILKLVRRELSGEAVKPV